VIEVGDHPTGSGGGPAFVPEAAAGLTRKPPSPGLSESDISTTPRLASSAGEGELRDEDEKWTPTYVIRLFGVVRCPRR